MDLQKIYNNSPYWLQVVALNLFAGKVKFQRHGKSFKKFYGEYLETQYYSKEKILEYQNEKLRDIVLHSYETVPYYKRLFDYRNIKPNQIETIDDLSKIPILEKKDVIENANDLVSSKYVKHLVTGVTSGTTGSPLTVKWNMEACIYNDVVDWRQKHWAGIEFGNKMALLLGRPVVPVNKRRPPYWVLDYFHNQLWMSAFHMNRSNIPLYVEKLKQYKPRAIEGYPSTLYILAEFMADCGERLPLDAVFTSSETLYPVQREVIESVFQCRITDYYGMAERVLFATECNHHSKHVNFEYCIAEIVDEENEVLSDREDGYIVGTSLVNYGMPFLRYKTTDITNIDRSVRCQCGRSMDVIADIKTKAEDMVIRTDGTKISPSVLTHPFKPMKSILKSQVIQEDLTHITVKIIKNEEYSEQDSIRLIKALKERAGQDMEITLEFVDDIPRTSSGKYRWVISHVGKQFSK